MSTVRIVASVFAIVALAAVTMHHPRVRTILFGNAGAVGCPQLASDGRVAEARRTALAALAGSARAPQNKLFGLAVGRDARSDVRAWAAARELRCDNLDADAVRCARSTKLLGRLGLESDVYLRFTGDRLVAVDAVGALATAEATRAYESVRDDIVASFGPAHGQSALGDVASAGRVASTWRFAELAIDLSVFAAGDAPRLRMQVRALR